jgi:hypothetical protein
MREPPPLISRDVPSARLHRSVTADCGEHVLAPETPCPTNLVAANLALARQLQQRSYTHLEQIGRLLSS